MISYILASHYCKIFTKYTKLDNSTWTVQTSAKVADCVKFVNLARFYWEENSRIQIEILISTKSIPARLDKGVIKLM